MIGYEAVYGKSLFAVNEILPKLYDVTLNWYVLPEQMAEIAIEKIVLPQSHKIFELTIIRDFYGNVAHANPSVCVDIEEWRMV